MFNSFFSPEELQIVGFKNVGENVFISRHARFYSPAKITIGSNVRIDDFCILSGTISIGNNVHIAAGSFLFGGVCGVHIGDHVNISSRCGIYAISDDFSAPGLIGAMESAPDRTIINLPVRLMDYCAVGTGATILPGSTLEPGSVLGAMSLAKSCTLRRGGVYIGVPCRYIKDRW